MSGGVGSSGGMAGVGGGMNPADELLSLAQSRAEIGSRREAELARARVLLTAHKVWEGDGGDCM